MMGELRRVLEWVKPLAGLALSVFLLVVLAHVAGWIGA